MTFFPVKKEDQSPLEASKWLAFCLLVDPTEMEALVSTCAPFFLCNVSECVSKEEGLVERADFLRCYQNYVERLRSHEIPKRSDLRPFFSTAWSASKSALIASPVLSNQWIVKPLFPVIQLNAHFFSFSMETGRFHSMVHGGEMVPWGIQFSYPQLYICPVERKPSLSLKNKELVNNRLFAALKKWVRRFTRPARFYCGEKRLTATFRVSQSAARWMASYPLLKQMGLELKSEH